MSILLQNDRYNLSVSCVGTDNRAAGKSEEEKSKQNIDSISRHVQL